MPNSSYCRREAYRLFRAQMKHLETTRGLLLASIAIASHQLDDVDPQQVEDRLDEFARSVLEHVRSGDQKALLAHLHAVMFEEEGFSGNNQDYYNPLNSYLPVVVETKRGIPISLSLIYKCVAERVGLQVRGINAPGHFLTSVKLDESWMLIDPFFGGRVMTPPEAVGQISKILGHPVSSPDKMLEVASHRDWLVRMLQNLQVIFAQSGRLKDRAAMNELQQLLN